MSIQIKTVGLAKLDSNPQNKPKINFPAMVFTQPQSSHLQTRPPYRPTTPSKKTSLPMKTCKKQDTSSNQNYNSSNLQHKRTKQSNRTTCQNHENKAARYVAASQGELLSYCEKCSIYLASQGFAVQRIGGEVDGKVASQPRAVEVESFISELDVFVKFVQSHKQSTLQTLNKIDQQYSQHTHNLCTYFNDIQQTLSNYRSSLFTSLQQHKQTLQAQLNQTLIHYETFIQQCRLMRQDIVEFLEVVLIAQQEQYRPVMESYYLKLGELKGRVREEGKENQGREWKSMSLVTVGFVRRMLREYLGVVGQDTMGSGNEVQELSFSNEIESSEQQI